MPAAAVIPAPRVYIKVLAVKKLVVGLWVGARSPPRRAAGIEAGRFPPCSRNGSMVKHRFRRVYFEEIRVFKAGESP